MQDFLDECRQQRETDFDAAPLVTIGSIPIELRRLEEMFPDYNIRRGWSHFMSFRGTRKPHSHIYDVGLYYLYIPPDSGKLYFTDNGEVIEPVTGDFRIIERNRKHGITEHLNKEEDRWAIAFEIKL